MNGEANSRDLGRGEGDTSGGGGDWRRRALCRRVGGMTAGGEGGSGEPVGGELEREERESSISGEGGGGGVGRVWGWVSPGSGVLTAKRKRGVAVRKKCACNWR